MAWGFFVSGVSRFIRVTHTNNIDRSISVDRDSCGPLTGDRPMRAFIGLTRAFWTEYESLRLTLSSIGITTIQDAREVCTESEMRRLEMAKRVLDNPDTNLWNQSYQTL